jgi:hypothetical protein
MNANGPNTGSFFDYGFGEVKGVTPGGTAAFVGRAWLGAPTYDAATVRGAVSWTQTIGTEIRPLPAPAILKFPGLAIYEGAIWLNNYDVNQPIFFFDGTTVQLAPFLTRVQVLGRPVGSNREFQVLTNHGGAGSTFFTGQGQDAGLFDAGYGVVPGVPQFGPAEVVVRAWRGANTWESALTNMQAFVGQSSIFTNRTGQSSPFPGLPTPAILDMPSFTIYPFPQACGLVPFVGSRPLCMGVSANGQALEFTWPDLGTNYVYTLEFTPSLTATNWTPVPDATWPARTNQFTLPNPPVARSFYRVKAQAVQ